MPLPSKWSPSYHITSLPKDFSVKSERGQRIVDQSCISRVPDVTNSWFKCPYSLFNNCHTISSCHNHRLPYEAGYGDTGWHTMAVVLGHLTLLHWSIKKNSSILSCTHLTCIATIWLFIDAILLLDDKFAIRVPVRQYYLPT